MTMDRVASSFPWISQSSLTQTLEHVSQASDVAALRLDLASSAVPDLESCQAVFKALGSLPSLAALSVSFPVIERNFGAAESIDSAEHSLRESQRLKMIRYFVNLTLKRSSSLKYLDLSGNRNLFTNSPFSSEIDVTETETRFDIASSTRDIQGEDESLMDLIVDLEEDLIKFLSATQLRFLDLSMCELSDDEVPLLKEMLGKNVSLKSMKFDNNKFSAQGIIDLTKACLKVEVASNKNFQFSNTPHPVNRMRKGNSKLIEGGRSAPGPLTSTSKRTNSKGPKDNTLRKSVRNGSKLSGLSKTKKHVGGTVVEISFAGIVVSADLLEEVIYNLVGRSSQLKSIGFPSFAAAEESERQNVVDALLSIEADYLEVLVNYLADNFTLLDIRPVNLDSTSPTRLVSFYKKEVQRLLSRNRDLLKGIINAFLTKSSLSSDEARKVMPKQLVVISPAPVDRHFQSGSLLERLFGNDQVSNTKYYDYSTISKVLLLSSGQVSVGYNAGTTNTTTVNGVALDASSFYHSFSSKLLAASFQKSDPLANFEALEQLLEKDFLQDFDEAETNNMIERDQRLKEMLELRKKGWDCSADLDNADPWYSTSTSITSNVEPEVLTVTTRQLSKLWDKPSAEPRQKYNRNNYIKWLKESHPYAKSQMNPDANDQRGNKKTSRSAFDKDMFMEKVPQKSTTQQQKRSPSSRTNNLDMPERPSPIQMQAEDPLISALRSSQAEFDDALEDVQELIGFFTDASSAELNGKRILEAREVSYEFDLNVKEAALRKVGSKIGVNGDDRVRNIQHLKATLNSSTSLSLDGSMPSSEVQSLSSMQSYQSMKFGPALIGAKLIEEKICAGLNNFKIIESLQGVARNAGMYVLNFDANLLQSSNGLKFISLCLDEIFSHYDQTKTPPTLFLALKFPTRLTTAELKRLSCTVQEQIFLDKPYAKNIEKYKQKGMKLSFFPLYCDAGANLEEQALKERLLECAFEDPMPTGQTRNNSKGKPMTISAVRKPTAPSNQIPYRFLRLLECVRNMKVRNPERFKILSLSRFKEAIYELKIGFDAGEIDAGLKFLINRNEIMIFSPFSEDPEKPLEQLVVFDRLFLHYPLHIISNRKILVKLLNALRTKVGFEQQIQQDYERFKGKQKLLSVRLIEMLFKYVNVSLVSKLNLSTNVGLSTFDSNSFNSSQLFYENNVLSFKSLFIMLEDLKYLIPWTNLNINTQANNDDLEDVAGYYLVPPLLRARPGVTQALNRLRKYKITNTTDSQQPPTIIGSKSAPKMINRTTSSNRSRAPNPAESIVFLGEDDSRPPQSKTHTHVGSLHPKGVSASSPIPKSPNQLVTNLNVSPANKPKHLLKSRAFSKSSTERLSQGKKTLTRVGFERPANIPESLGSPNGSKSIKPASAMEVGPDPMSHALLSVDLKKDYIPNEVFVHLCTVVYQQYLLLTTAFDPEVEVDYLIEKVELYQNIFKLTFASFDGSLLNPEDAEYITLGIDTKTNVIVGVARNQTLAPLFLTMVRRALRKVIGHEDFLLKVEVVMPRPTLHASGSDTLQAQVELVDVQTARKKSLSPWFSHMKRIIAGTPHSGHSDKDSADRSGSVSSENIHDIEIGLGGLINAKPYAMKKHF